MLFDFMLLRPLSWKTYLPFLCFLPLPGGRQNNFELSTSLKKPTLI